MLNDHNNSNAKDISITEYTNIVGNKLNYIGITKVNTAKIRKAYRALKTVSDAVFEQL